MLDLLTATAVVVALVAVVLALVVGLTVLPFVRAVDLADGSGGSPARAGALTLGTAGLGLLLALLVLRSELPRPVLLVPLLLCWSVPVVLALARRAPGGRGAHE
ncbi:MAG: hypothetical protein JWO60_2300 [Frankiales bacterium]|nr:hypothetical protein [Frankiales bacterium]